MTDISSFGFPSDTASLLRRLHVRKGYQAGYAAADAWAVMADLVIVAIVFWVLSGLWMWWEMKATRAGTTLPRGSTHGNPGATSSLLVLRLPG